MLDFLKQLQIKVAQNPDYFHLSIENHSTECTAPSLLSWLQQQNVMFLHEKKDT